jgi:hypothetical protein
MNDLSVFPKPQLILDYQNFFGIYPPENRISLIKNISRSNILFELAALNYRLKPKNEVHIDTSFQTQVKELKYFTQVPDLFKKYANKAEKFTKNKKEYPLIFTRQACVFAIEEILNSSEMRDIENFEMAKIENWEAIIKYILAVNFTITQIRENYKEVNTFESLNPKLLPLNELVIEVDQILTPYRGYKLFEYLQNNSIFSQELKNYFIKKYNCESEYFIYEILKMYILDKHENPEHEFFYYVKEEQQFLFDILSRFYPNREINKLLSIRKSPFIKTNSNEYIVTDISFLIEKVYTQFINDFWFDWIRKIDTTEGKKKYDISLYRSEFGYFFENYIKDIFQKSFSKYVGAKLLLFDELKINFSKSEIEIADVYLRHNNKVLLGQVKSGSIYDKEKFGGTIDELYKKDRNKFFKNFGVNQIIDSIQNLEHHIKTLDDKYPKGHLIHIYPCIIVNDKIFQTPLMPNAFNVRFNELKKTIANQKVHVHELNVIHINDLERIEYTLGIKPHQIWKFIKHNQRDKRFIPPFYNTVNKLLIHRRYSKKVIELFDKLVKKYNPDD